MYSHKQDVKVCVCLFTHSAQFKEVSETLANVVEALVRLHRVVASPEVWTRKSRIDKGPQLTFN